MSQPPKQPGLIDHSDLLDKSGRAEFGTRFLCRYRNMRRQKMLLPRRQRNHGCDWADPVAFVVLQHDDRTGAGLFAADCRRQLTKPDVAAANFACS